MRQRSLGFDQVSTGSQASSHFEAWNFTCLSSGKSGVRLPVELRRGTWFFSRVSTRESELPLWCERILGVPLKSVQGNQAISRVERELGVLSNCVRNGKVLHEFQGETGLLLRCEGKVGISLGSKQGNQTSARDEVGNTGLFLSFDGSLSERLELHKGSEVSYQVLRGNLGLLSRSCRGKEPHLALRGESRGFSRVVAGSFGFLSTCDGALRETLLLTQRSQDSFELRGEVQDCSRVTARESGHILCLRGNAMVFHELQQEALAFSQIATGTSGSLLCCLREVRTPFELQGAPRDSSLVTAGE